MNADIAVVTGAGTGVGRAVCLELAQRGTRGIVVNYSRSRAEAEETVAQLRGAGCSAFAHRADVSEPRSVDAMISTGLDRFGRIDVLVNNAATTRLIPFEDLGGITPSDWERMFAVNVLGAFHCTRAAAPALRAASGSVVNIASVAGSRASGTSIPYGVTKAALAQLTRSLARALAPEIRVNTVSPGAVESRWMGNLLGTDAAEHYAAHVGRTPLARLAQPDDIARAVVGLIQADHVTGQELTVDGGRSILY